MAEPFKNLINPETIRQVAEWMEAAGPFETGSFCKAAEKGLDDLELKDRVRHLSTCLRETVGSDYLAALEQILKALPKPLEGTDEVTGGIAIWPLCDFIERYGLSHPKQSVAAMREITKRFSCEFAIRPYLDADPETVLVTLGEWVTDPDPHVRRLISEGTRPLLPWGMRLQAFRENPEPVIELLDRLKDDPEEYVRRSVANNLNDIAKDHPDRVVEIATSWSEEASTERKKLVRHAIRTLLKKGHPGALAILGFGPPKLDLELRVHTARVAMGDDLVFSARINSRKRQDLMIDYTIHHRKANGSLSPKVFKWSTRTVARDETVEIERRHSFKPVTTRRYYAGSHRVEVTINGQSFGTADFDLEG